MKLVRLITAALAVALLSVLALACGDDDDGGSAEDKAAVEQSIKDLASYSAKDVDAFLDRVTDDFLLNFNGFTRDECRDNAADCVGEPADSPPTFVNTKVAGDTASTDATFQSGGEKQEFRLSLVRENGAWKLDDLAGVPKEIPAGVKKVDLELNEFAFGFNRKDVTDGDFAFVVKNTGEQRHQVVVSKIPADLDLEAAINSQEQPEGTEDISQEGPFKPGAEGTVVFDGALEPGRYALICFLPDTDDPDRTAHALKGMYADFTVE